MSRVATAMCWAPGALVELEVLVDLRLALALGGLVDRELHEALAVADDLGHERRVLGRDVLVGEVDHLGHPEDVLVVLDPRLHRAELDVADDVVDGQQHAAVLGAVLDGARSRGGRARRSRRARRRCAASRRRSGSWRALDGAVLVGELVGLGDALGAAASWPRGRRGRRSGTLRAMTFTPSPCLCWWAAIGEPESSAPVRTRRMRPCCRTWETWSRVPVSRPR